MFYTYLDAFGFTSSDVIISGCAKGADTLAIDYANDYMIGLDMYPADWDTYGRRAGPIRNQQMIDEGKPDIAIGFPGGRGSADMRARVIKHGIELYEPKY